MDRFQTGNRFSSEYHRDQYWDPFYSQYISRINISNNNNTDLKFTDSTSV